MHFQRFQVLTFAQGNCAVLFPFIECSYFDIRDPFAFSNSKFEASSSSVHPTISTKCLISLENIDNSNFAWNASCQLWQNLTNLVHRKWEKFERFLLILISIVFSREIRCCMDFHYILVSRISWPLHIFDCEFLTNRASDFVTNFAKCPISLGNFNS